MTRWNRSLGWSLFAALLVVSPVAKAQQGAPDTARQRAEVKRLMGKFSWGMNSTKVTELLIEEIRDDYKDRLKKAVGDALTYDRIHGEMENAIRKVKMSHVKFEGQRSPWDVSLVEKEFAHRKKNSEDVESMIVSWGDRDRRFFFFYKDGTGEDRLWKIYVAFNAELFKDKTFSDFAAIMERRFGPAERKQRKTLTGDKVMDHLAWPVVAGTALRAIDNSTFYGNYCLALTSRKHGKRVIASRQAVPGGRYKRYHDTFVDAVRGNPENLRENEDIVDRITGQHFDTPTEVDTHQEPKPSKEKVPGSIDNKVQRPPAAKRSINSSSLGRTAQPLAQTY